MIKSDIFLTTLCLIIIFSRFFNPFRTRGLSQFFVDMYLRMILVSLKLNFHDFPKICLGKCRSEILSKTIEYNPMEAMLSRPHISEKPHFGNVVSTF